MKMAEYWVDRSERVLLAAEKQGSELTRSLIDFYSNTGRQIQRDIDAFFGRYASDNNLSIQEVQKRLTEKELRRFQEEMRLYLSEAKRLGLDKNHVEYLRSLAGRAYISRQQELLAQVKHQLETLSGKTDSAFSSTIGKVYNDSYYRSIFYMQQGLGFGYDFARMDTKTVEALIKKPWLGENYSSRIWQNKARLLQQLEQTIPQAFALGKNSRVLGEQIADRLGVSRRAGERLARTEVNHAANEASKRAYQEIGVAEYEYLATLDNRTSDICAALDGKVFRVSDTAPGVNYPPMHPNCRSTTIPYFPPDEFDEPSSRAARDIDGRYYTVPADMTYAQWREKYLGEKLTLAEERAIKTYIGASSYSLNAKLRDDAALSTEEKRTLRALDSALEKLPKYEGMVYRSVFFDTEREVREFLLSLAEGEVSFPAYTSASTVVYDTSDSVRLVIQSSIGADARGYNQAEQEIIFGRGFTFRATKMEMMDGKPTVYLEEVADGKTQ